MIGWARDKRRGWHRRSSHEQVETTNRWLLNIPHWSFYIGGVPPLFPATQHSSAGTALAWGVAVLGFGQCVIAGGALRQGTDFRLGEAEPPRRQLAALTVTTLVLTGMVTAIIATVTLEQVQAPGMAMFGVMAPFTGVYGLTVSMLRGTKVLSGYAVLVLVAFALAGMGPGNLVGTAILLVVGLATSLFTPRCSAWYIAVMRELADAREAQSRLAVAEERLRFGRDLHDVMGRNLSVIALKSELAVQLARRGPEAAEKAVEQMNEVQQLARESQTEVREVVRGYREAGLDTELAGARGVLRAAGVDCRIEGADVDVPPRAQSALGWVVREAATNVLRHADASRCTVRVRAGAGVEARDGDDGDDGDRDDGVGVGVGAVVLEVENDGARGDAGTPEGGSGLPGLRERLAALGGTLTASHDGHGTFRLRAEIPGDPGDHRSTDEIEGTEGDDGRERREPEPSERGPSGSGRNVDGGGGGGGQRHPRPAGR